jgi:hypothetical protein
MRQDQRRLFARPFPHRQIDRAAGHHPQLRLFLGKTTTLHRKIVAGFAALKKQFASEMFFGYSEEALVLN